MIEMLRRLALGLALAGYSCTGGGQPPQPPQPPPPQPQCAEGQGCGCWHYPPEAMGWLYACCAPGVPGGVVNVQDPAQCPPPPAPTCPTCPPGQTCTDPAVGCVPNQPTSDCAPALDPGLSAPVAPDSAWSYAADQTADGTWKQSVWNAAIRARAACPEAWNGYCMAAGPSAIDHGYRLIAKQLQLVDIAASQAVVGGETKDHLWVRRSPSSNDWNGTKLFFYGNGCLITGDGAFTVHGWYTYAGGTTPPPVEPSPGCSAPLPEQVWTAATIPPGFDQGLIGHTRYVMTCRAHGAVVDCTAQNQRACDYCAAIGMGEAGGQIRCGCPVRNECLPPEQTPPQNFKCEERVACEKYLTSGTILESRNGATCEFADSNPFMFRPNDGNCRLCGANGTTYNGERLGCGGWH